jgi:hypothetical protein
LGGGEHGRLDGWLCGPDPLFFRRAEIFMRGEPKMLEIAGGILISMVVLAFAGFMLTVSANWIFKDNKTKTDYRSSNGLRKN